MLTEQKYSRVENGIPVRLMGSISGKSLRWKVAVSVSLSRRGFDFHDIDVAGQIERNGVSCALSHTDRDEARVTRGRRIWGDGRAGAQQKRQ